LVPEMWLFAEKMLTMGKIGDHLDFYRTPIIH